MNEPNGHPTNPLNLPTRPPTFAQQLDQIGRDLAQRIEASVVIIACPLKGGFTATIASTPGHAEQFPNLLRYIAEEYEKKKVWLSFRQGGPLA